MSRPSSLSPEQAAELAEFRRQWHTARNTTAPADRAAAEEGVRRAYRAAGLKEPKRIVWTNGPVSMAKRWCESRCLEPIGANVKSRIVDAVQSKVVNDIDYAVSASVRLALFETRLVARDAIGVAVIESVLDAANVVRPGISARVRGLFKRLQPSSSGMAPAMSFGMASFGQHDIGWLGICQFLGSAFDMASRTRPLDGLWMLARSVGWVLPHENTCWLAERHNVLAVDANNRLHADKGPALAYPDGWSVHYWKGVRVPAWIIEQPHLITASAIDRELNRNIRRCMIDIMTPEKFIAACGAVPVSVDETGVLWRKQWFRDAWAAVEVINGTPEPDGTRRRYFLQVPPDLHSAREAVAWTYGMTAQQYAGLRLRT